MLTTSRTRWWCYDITVSTPDGTWHWRETDPQEALAKASAQIFAPALDNLFEHPGAIGALNSGTTIRVTCVDGAVIAVTPVLL